MKKKPFKIGIISSCGGHLTEVRLFKSVFCEFQHFYVLNDKALLARDMVGKTYFVTHSERDLKFFINLYEAFRILKRERPSVLLSTGAGIIVPFSLVAKFIFRIKIIYIETLASASVPSLTGKIMYYVADFFYYPWARLKKYFPKGRYLATYF